MTEIAIHAILYHPRHFVRNKFSTRKCNKAEVMLQAENILEVLYISVFYDGEHGRFTSVP